MAKKPYNMPSKPSSRKTPRRATRTKEKLESTTRIRVDKERLEDTSSLDTSFLEGRVDAQSRKKILNSKPNTKKTIDLSILRNVLLIVGLVTLLVFAVLGLMNHSTKKSTTASPNKIKTVTKETIVKVVDDNYLFVGDYHTNRLDFEDLDYHYNRLADDGYDTRDIIKDIDDIYRYNPSLIVIEVGMNDLNRGLEDAEIITNLSEIIDGIKKNRKSAKIYVESVYPIDTDNPDLVGKNVSNDRIIDLNSMIEELTKDKKVEYIDVFREIAKDDKLNDEYTENGFYLNDTGYEKVWNLLSKVVDGNDKED